jgi:hypothetical protein
MGLLTQEDPIGIAGGLNLYGFADGDPINFSDPFGLAVCDPDRDLDCEFVSQATGGVTLGSKWSLKSALIGLSVRGGISGELGVRHTLNRVDGQAENDFVFEGSVGLEISLNVFGAELSFRLGPDTSDPEGGAIADIDEAVNPTLEVQGMFPLVGLGVSGTYRVNPLAAVRQLSSPLPLASSRRR